MKELSYEEKLKCIDELLKDIPVKGSYGYICHAAQKLGYIDNHFIEDFEIVFPEMYTALSNRKAKIGSILTAFYDTKRYKANKLRHIFLIKFKQDLIKQYATKSNKT